MIQLGVWSCGPPAGSPDIRQTVSMSRSPARRIVSWSTADWRSPSVGCSWLPLALSAISAQAPGLERREEVLTRRSAREQALEIEMRCCGPVAGVDLDALDAEALGRIQHRLEGQMRQQVRNHADLHMRDLTPRPDGRFQKKMGNLGEPARTGRRCPWASAPARRPACARRAPARHDTTAHSAP